MCIALICVCVNYLSSVDRTLISLYFTLNLTSSRQAVLLLNTVHIILNTWALTFFILANKHINSGSTDLTRDQTNTFNTALPYLLTLYCITIVVNFSTMWAAKTFDYCLVDFGLFWYFIQMGYTIWFALSMGWMYCLLFQLCGL